MKFNIELTVADKDGPLDFEYRCYTKFGYYFARTKKIGEENVGMNFRGNEYFARVRGDSALAFFAAFLADPAAFFVTSSQYNCVGIILQHMESKEEVYRVLYRYVLAYEKAAKELASIGFKVRTKGLRRPTLVAIAKKHGIDVESFLKRKEEMHKAVRASLTLQE